MESGLEASEVCLGASLALRFLVDRRPREESWEQNWHPLLYAPVSLERIFRAARQGHAEKVKGKKHVASSFPVEHSAETLRNSSVCLHFKKKHK